MKTMTTAQRFFWEHAGYSWNAVEGETRAQGRRRCAESLASAETWAQEQGMTFTWDFDQDADLSWMTDEERAQEHEVLGCVARYRDGSVAGSLGGVIDPDDMYLRVVEAELASEARSEAINLLMEGI
jgi:hypothetical protein